MGVLVHIGEVGVHHAGGSHILRPSLLAMSRLGTPAEIVSTVAVVFGQGLNCHPKVRKIAHKQQLRAALEVWQACAPEDVDLDPITGRFSPRGGWVMGRADPADVVIVAQALLRHGVLGDPEPKNPNESEKDGDYSPTFDCRKHAALAMGHLSLSEPEAWNMTMTGLRLALEAKYPKPENPAEQSAKRAPSESEYHSTMEWFEKVQAARGEQ
jgi:hypothetical protein